MARYRDRGPTSSAAYNEENRSFADRVRSVETGLVSISGRVSDLETMLAAEASTVGAFADVLDQISTSIGVSSDGYAIIPMAGVKFIKNVAGTDYTEANGTTVIASPLEYDTKAGLLTLKKSSAERKLRIEAVAGTWVVHPEVRHAAVVTPSGVYNLSNEEYAIDGKAARACLLTSTEAKAWQIAYHVSTPMLSVANRKSNMISIDLAPACHCQLIELQYTTTPNPELADGAHWVDLPYEMNVAEKDRWQPPTNNNFQTDVVTRRYYLPDTDVTGLRVVAKTKMNGATPVPVDIDGVDTYMVGIRDIDIAHVNFATGGSIVAEVKLPVTAATIDSVKPLCVNLGGGDIDYDDSDISLYILSGGNWVAYTAGNTANTDTFRVKINLSSSAGTSPVLSAIEVAYS